MFHIYIVTGGNIVVSICNLLVIRKTEKAKLFELNRWLGEVGYRVIVHTLKIYRHFHVSLDPIGLEPEEKWKYW